MKIVSSALGALDEALVATGSLAGKLVLACAFPMNADDTELVIGRPDSGAEELARRSGAKVVETLGSRITLLGVA